MGNEFVRGVESKFVDVGHSGSGIEIETRQNRSDFDVNFDGDGDRSSIDDAFGIIEGEEEGRRAGDGRERA